MWQWLRCIVHDNWYDICAAKVCTTSPSEDQSQSQDDDEEKEKAPPYRSIFPSSASSPPSSCASGPPCMRVKEPARRNKKEKATQTSRNQQLTKAKHVVACKLILHSSSSSMSQQDTCIAQRSRQIPFLAHLPQPREPARLAHKGSPNPAMAPPHIMLCLHEKQTIFFFFSFLLSAAPVSPISYTHLSRNFSIPALFLLLRLRVPTCERFLTVLHCTISYPLAGYHRAVNWKTRNRTI